MGSPLIWIQLDSNVTAAYADGLKYRIEKQTPPAYTLLIYAKRSVRLNEPGYSTLIAAQDRAVEWQTANIIDPPIDPPPPLITLTAADITALQIAKDEGSVSSTDSRIDPAESAARGVVYGLRSKGLLQRRNSGVTGHYVITLNGLAAYDDLP